MKVFRYFGPLFLLCVSQLIVDSPCKAEVQLSHVKRLGKDLPPSLRSNDGRKNTVEKDFKRKKIVDEETKETGSVAKKRDWYSSNSASGNELRNVGIKNKMHVSVAEKADRNSTKPPSQSHNIEGAKGVRIQTIYSHSRHSIKSNLTNIKPHGISDDLHSKKNTTNRKLFKKYALFQSLPESQSEDYQPIITGGDPSNEENGQSIESEQTGDVRAQGFSQVDQQQQPMMSDGNSPLQSPLQYGGTQDSAAYQQDNSQSSLANFATNSNSEDAGQSEGGQPTSLEQAIQLQQAAYTQHPPEQGQDQESIAPDSQGGELAGQESQMIDAGQMQYQGEQPGQGQEQVAQEQQSDQEQGAGQAGFGQASFQQEQPQELDQQQSQVIDQQQQDQTQEYQQQQQDDQQQQTGEEPQESEGSPSESQSLATSLFGSEGQQTAEQTAPEQQGQGTVSYANEQPNEGGDKGAGPAVTYASSIEEALKEPAVTPQESNSEGGDGQGSLGASDGASVINIGTAADSKDGSNNGFIGAGTISSPTGYQTSTVDDNGNPIQPGPDTEVNSYAPTGDQAANGETNEFEGSQQIPSSSSSESQNTFNFAPQRVQQQRPGPKVPPLEDDVYKIINIANKNAPMAGKITFYIGNPHPNF